MPISGYTTHDESIWLILCVGMILLDMGIQKAMMPPKVVIIDSILKLVAANTMQEDLENPNNEPQGYPKFINESKLDHTITVGCVFDPLVLKSTQFRAFCF